VYEESLINVRLGCNFHTVVLKITKSFLVSKNSKYFCFDLLVFEIKKAEKKCHAELGQFEIFKRTI